MLKAFNLFEQFFAAHTSRAGLVIRNYDSMPRYALWGHEALPLRYFPLGDRIKTCRRWFLFASKVASQELHEQEPAINKSCLIQNTLRKSCLTHNTSRESCLTHNTSCESCLTHSSTSCELFIFLFALNNQIERCHCIKEETASEKSTMNNSFTALNL